MSDNNRSGETVRQRPRGPMGPGMGAVIVKPKDFKKTMWKLIIYCRKYLPVVIIAMIFAAAGTVLQIIGPDKLKEMTDEIMKGMPHLLNGTPVLGAIDLNAVRNTGFLLVFFYAGSTVINFIQGYIMATISQKISMNLRTGISKKINKLPLKYFDKTSFGDVLSRVTNDVDAIGVTMNQSIGSLVTSITMIAGSVIMMFYNNWIMALTALITSVFGFAFTAVIMKKSQKYFVRQQKDLGEVNGHVEEMYSGHIAVKAYNAGAESKRIFEKVNFSLFESGWKSQFLSGLMMPLMQFIGNFGYVAVCVTGAALAMSGRISFGVIVAFMIYIRLFTQPLSQLAQVFQSLQRIAAASERVFEFYEEEEMADESKKANNPISIKGDIEFRNVKFGYIPGKTVIHNFSANIKAGQKIAIVGPTGAGKTTIVNLLMSFYDLEGGEIFLDGIPISCVPRKFVHEQFSMVLQDTWIFEGTIKENIVYCKQDVPDEKVIEACKAAGLHHFIKSMPQGYDTLFNDKVNLSQGQKQLVTIARAMIQNAPMLILDEATSSVDTRTEHLIQKAMDKLTYGRTSFVIAHRLSTIKHADLIFVMNEGDIIESGNHNELLAKKGFYADLYYSQFENSEKT